MEEISDIDLQVDTKTLKKWRDKRHASLDEKLPRGLKKKILAEVSIIEKELERRALQRQKINPLSRYTSRELGTLETDKK